LYKEKLYKSAILYKKMKKEIALKIILAISIAGMLFSGYLSYTEIFNGVCSMGSCSSVASIPACVYGLAMYLVVFVISLLGLKKK
jgi:uncharacterized membrane protein